MNIPVLLERAYAILTNSTATSDAPISLYNGKLGHALFLYHLADHMDAEKVFGQADDIVTTALSQIGNLHSPHFGTGQIGVGWALQYLNNQDFISTNSRIFHPFDDLLFKRGLSVSSFLLRDGILGMCAYCWLRQESFILKDLTPDSSLLTLQQRSFFIQLVDILQFKFSNYIKQMELTSPESVIRYETVSLSHLQEFTMMVLPVYHFLRNIHEHAIIPTIIRSFMSYLEALIENMQKVLFKKQDQTDMLDIEGYFFIITMMMLPESQLRISDNTFLQIALEDERNQQAWINTAMLYKSAVPFMYTAVIAYHQTGSEIFRNLALKIAVHAIDVAEQQSSLELLSLERGLSGIGMSLLTLQDPAINKWAASIGFN